jgi:hypothetical protein
VRAVARSTPSPARIGPGSDTVCGTKNRWTTVSGEIRNVVDAVLPRVEVEDSFFSEWTRAGRTRRA